MGYTSISANFTFSGGWALTALLEALALKVADVRIVDGAAQSVRVIGMGDKERRVPLPAAFGAEFGDWIKDRPNGELERMEPLLLLIRNVAAQGDAPLRSDGTSAGPLRVRSVWAAGMRGRSMGCAPDRFQNTSEK